MSPNEQQLQAIEAVESGRNVYIQAVAGSGKSTTLAESVKRLLKKHDSMHASVMMFNKKAADSLAGKISHPRCQVSTLHSYAYKRMVPKYSFIPSLLKPHPSTHELSKLLQIKPLHINADNTVIPTVLCALAVEWMQEFCKRPDQDFSASNFPSSALFKHISPTKKIKETDVVQHLLPVMRHWWGLGWRGGAPITHDMYMKQWFLEDGVIRSDAVFVDEFQDTNALAEAIYAKAPKLTVVGDPYQEIYEFRGTGDRTRCINFDEHIVMHKSYRFGPEIAEKANAILKDWLGSDVQIEGNPLIKSSIMQRGTPDMFDAIVCRSQNGVLWNTVQAVRNRVPFVSSGISFSRILEAGEHIHKLREGGKVSSHLIPHGIKTFDDLLEARNELKSSQEAWVIALNMYEEHNMSIDKLRVILGAIQEFERPEGLHILTTHAAKGLEYDRVLVHHDFSDYAKDATQEKQREEEYRLAYVAVTRARRSLKVPSYFPNMRENIDFGSSIQV